MNAGISWGNTVLDTVCEKVKTGQPISYREVLMADRLLATINADDRRKRLPRRIKIALGGNCSTDFLAFGLRVALAALGIEATIHETPYDNWITEALSGTPDVDYWVVWMTSMGATVGSTVRKEMDYDAVGAACQKILERGQRIMIILPEALELEDDPFSPFRAWRQTFTKQMETLLPDGVIRLPVDHVQRQMGAAQWFAPRYWSLAKAPCHPNAATLVAMEAAKTLSQAMVLRIKAVVVDLDNTLWGGVIGDDGIDGIKLDPFGEGRPFLMMQQYLKDIQAAGIPLNVVSKNEPDNARSPFISNPWMPLTLTDFIHFHASWEPKHIAIRTIAEQLNLGLDAICFLDDSPHERAEAKEVLPDLVVPELSVDPEARVPALVRSGLFITPVVLKDDLQRVQRYREGVMRQQAQAGAVSLEAYQRDLAMVLSPVTIGPANLARATALLQKTNQFNLTNRRHTAADVQNLLEADNIYAYCFSLADRFGDSGIIGVVIGQAQAAQLTLDSWVLSCRAFGRGVEWAMLQHIMEWSQERNITTLFAPFLLSQKNKLVKDFLIESQFTPQDNVSNNTGENTLFSAQVTVDKSKHMLTIQS